MHGRRQPHKKKLSRTPRKNKQRRALPLPTRFRQYAFRALRAASWPVKATMCIVVVAGLWLAINWCYQVVRKPTELYFPVSGALAKMPRETWREYAPLFRRHSTRRVTPELLAALAQVEAAGNPVARTYWRWSITTNPFEIYRPASSAVGMYQMTDAAFDAAKRYCIHDHVVVEDGLWDDWRSCWFNVLYTRVLPTNAVELTAALLDREVTKVLARQRIATASPAQQQNLAAVIHLCGAAAGARYVARGFRVAPGEHCGAHDVRGYLGAVNAMKRTFVRLNALGPRS